MITSLIATDARGHVITVTKNPDGQLSFDRSSDAEEVEYPISMDLYVGSEIVERYVLVANCSQCNSDTGWVN